MKKVIALCVIMVLGLTFAACNKSEPKEEKSDPVKTEGSVKNRTYVAKDANGSLKYVFDERTVSIYAGGNGENEDFSAIEGLEFTENNDEVRIIVFPDQEDGITTLTKDGKNLVYEDATQRLILAEQ